AGNRFRGPKAEALARKLSRSCWTGSPTVTGLVESLPRTLSGIGSKVAVAEQSPTHAQILVRRWPWAAYGTIGTHIAVFLIAVGAVLGCLPWTSMNDYIQIVEGETHVDSDDVFGFDVRLDDFRMDWYEDSGRPSTYESDVVLLVGDEEVKSGTATVNSPIKHSAIQFGQSSWGLSGLKMRITGPDGETIISTLPTAMAPTQHDGRGWDLDPQQRFVRFADDQAAVFATEFVLDAFEEDGEMKGSWSTSDPRNPAIQLQGIWGLDGEDHQFDELGWVYVGEEAKFHGYTIKFDDIVYMSALSVRRDFGIPFVWSGFILVSLGMIVMFYIQPRSFLVHVTEDSGEAGVYVASHERVFADADRKLIEDAAGVKLAPGTYAADGRSE
ncbi:MAG TPA: cytochrome c biogenesis protein ResB, partial [Armatimonadota bacterium]|nr:cytochrome c biogenesis protein ResB [Armatimonadota bacterium]